MIEISALALIFSFVLFLLLNVPIAVAISLSTLIAMFFTIPPLSAVTTLAQQMAVGINSFSLLAIPFFILSGLLMGKGGIARRLIDFSIILVGMLPGGLAFVSVMACMLFGAISGSSVAAASAVGTFLLPEMVKKGYSKNFNTALMITASTTGLLIPPSNIMIVYSLASGGVSIAALFLAGYIPGIIMGISLMFVAGIVAIVKKYPAGEKIFFKEALRRALDVIPSLLLIIIVIGGIIAGIFTPTEASGIAVVYAFILSVFIYREVRMKDIPEILLKTVEITAMIMFLIGSSKAMSWILSYENVPQNLGKAMLSLTHNKFGILLIINMILLVVGTFMDMTPAVLIFTPIFLPIVKELGIHPIHFGIIMILNLCIGLCTPPVGSVLFLGCGISGTKISDLIKPLLPLYVAMILVLFFITYFPQISLWLPRVFGY